VVNNRRVERNILGFTNAIIQWMIVFGYNTLLNVRFKLYLTKNVHRIFLTLNSLKYREMKRNCFSSAASHQTLKRSSRPFLNELEYVSLDTQSN
jgi:hypothetical protein